MVSLALLPSPTAPQPATVVTPMPTNRPTATPSTTSRSTSSATRSTTPLSTQPTPSSARTSTQKQVHHSSAVVGHDSKVVSHGYGYGKRDAEAEPGYGSQGYSSGPQCQQHVEKQCQKVPHQTQRQIPRQVCVPVEVKVPYEVCGTSYVQKQQYNTGYGYH